VWIAFFHDRGDMMHKLCGLLLCTICLIACANTNKAPVQTLYIERYDSKTTETVPFMTFTEKQQVKEAFDFVQHISWQKTPPPKTPYNYVFYFDTDDPNADAKVAAYYVWFDNIAKTAIIANDFEETYFIDKQAIAELYDLMMKKTGN
jgi:hypothetical protein